MRGRPFSSLSRWRLPWVMGLAVMGLAVMGLAAFDASAQSPEQRKRERLREQLGLPERPEPAPAKPKDEPPPADEPAPGDSAPAAPGPNADEKSKEGSGTPEDAERSAPRVYFSGSVHRGLLQECQSCHRPGAPAARSGFGLTGDLEADHRASRSFVVPGQPVKSKLITKGLGVAHGGGAVLREGGPSHARLLAWIQAGASLAAPAGATGASPAAGSPPSTPPSPLPPASAAPPAPAPAASSSAPSSPAAPAGTPLAPAAHTAPPPSGPEPLGFTPVHRLLLSSCGGCHRPGGMAGRADGFVTDEDPDVHYASARARIDPAAPRASLLWRRALGEAHAQVLDPASEGARTLLAWIEAGGPPPAPPPGAAERSAPSENLDAPAGGPSSQPQAAPPFLSPAAALQELGRLSPALEGLSLHGRFDLSYERRDYTGSPFSAGGRDVLRSYHQFLFLGRHVKGDPIGLDVELTSLQFWELSAHHRLGPVGVGVKLGKLLVPFGADPVYHHSYGGLAAFDQRLLPIIWAQEGVNAFAHGRLGPVGLSGDLYVVRGHRLRNAEARLSLQSDLSPVDDMRPALGGRARASYGPLGLWYSAYANGLGFGRLLFMQALDLGFWRWRDVPVLSDVSASFGLLRADISGAGAGEDYYHFGSYFQLRYHALDTVYFQYRQGLRSFENQRGLVLDSHNLTFDDASTHSLGVMAQWRGLYGGLTHFWNLEKRDEVEDDFLRLTVGYAF